MNKIYGLMDNHKLKTCHLTFLLLLCLYFGHLVAQPAANAKHQLFLLGRPDAEILKIRWAPSDYFSWQRCLEKGVIVERYTVAIDGVAQTTLPPPEIIYPRSAPLLPWSDESRWAALAEADDYAAIGAQTIYGSSFEISSTGASDDNLSQLLNQAEDQQNRLSFGLFSADQSFAAAQAMGLGFIDRQITPNATYIYRLYPVESGNTIIDTAYLSITANGEYWLPKVNDLSAEFKNQQVFLKWDAGIGQQFYTSYRIERSEDGITFESLNQLPYVSLSHDRKLDDQQGIYLDSLPANNRPYFYRISGKTIFGEYGPVSNVVQGMGLDPLPNTFPDIRGVTQDTDGGLIIRWQFPQVDAEKIAGFHISRSTTSLGTYRLISGPDLLPVSSRSFTDPSPAYSNYYKVIGVDAYGRQLPSFAALGQLNDQEPPAAPNNLRGKIMDDGTMVITWANNKEADLLGYRVFMANRPDVEFLQLTSEPKTKNFFVDTVSLSTLSEKIYVKVTAEDFRHNKSVFSEVIAVSRPDTIPPSPPIFKASRADEQGIYLKWAFSSSSDLDYHVLERKMAGSDDWIPLEEFDFFVTNTPTGAYTDTQAIRGINYHYRLVAIDDSGLRANSSAVEASRIDNGIRRPIERIRSRLDRRAKSIELSWDYEPESGLRHFEIYRAGAGAKLTVYQVVKPDDAAISGQKLNSFRFRDHQLSRQTTYAYKVRAVYEKGAKSPLSPSTVIAY